MLKLSKFDQTKRSPDLFAILTVLFALIIGLSGCSKNDDVMSDEAAYTKAGPGPMQMIASGLQGASGSTIGPDGFLYATEGAVGEIASIDPTTGSVSTFASGLPLSIPAIGIGGAVDVAFLNGTAYALVTLVGTDVGGNDVVGIYRIDSPTDNTVIADIGAFNIANPPSTDFFVPTGVQYAIQTYQGGFLVTDGHMNRMLNVTLDGEISIVKSFDNIVPTGIALSGNKIYMAEAGPVPHSPEDGIVVSFVPTSPKIKNEASGAPLLVDVEFGFAHRLYALSQGIWDGVGPGTPALPNTGSLVKADNKGVFTTIIYGIDRPTSLEFIGNTAYIVTLTGEVWSVDDVSNPPHGH